MKFVFDAILLLRGFDRLRPDVPNIRRTSAKFERDEVVHFIRGMWDAVTVGPASMPAW